MRSCCTLNSLIDVIETYRIYLITNLINGKKYVGQTYLTIDERWRDHVADAKCGGDVYFHRAIRKHGKDAFKIELLVDDLNEGNVDAFETKLIAEHKSDDPRYGYNGTRGGQGCRATHSTRALISAGKHGLTVDEVISIHRTVVMTYNERELGYKEIDDATQIIAGKAKLIIRKHRTKTCATCFDEEGNPHEKNLLVTRDSSSKPHNFGSLVSGWKKGSHYTNQQRVNQILKQRGMTLTEAQSLDASIFKMYQAGARLVDIMIAFDRSQSLVTHVIKWHEDGTCPLCFTSGAAST